LQADFRFQRGQCFAVELQLIVEFGEVVRRQFDLVQSVEPRISFRCDGEREKEGRREGENEGETAFCRSFALSLFLSVAIRCPSRRA
jgi:hypothetical protein